MSDFDNVKFTPVQYGMGVKISRDLLEAEERQWASRRPSLRLGKRWFARLKCRRKGHLPHVDGQCPRCGIVTVPPLMVAARMAAAARCTQEEMFRQAFR